MARNACLVALISAAAAFAQGGEQTKEVQSPEPVLEESQYQVFQKVTEANRRLKSAFDDQSLTTAQKDSLVQKEFDALKDLVSGKRWLMMGKIIDVTCADPSGAWEVTVGLPDTAESIRGRTRPVQSVRVDTELKDDEAIKLKKGDPFTFNGNLQMAKSKGWLDLSVTSAEAGGPRASTTAEFMKIRSAKKKIVYIVDRSGSMTNAMDYLKAELKRSIGKLQPDQQFHVIFFSSGPALEMPDKRLIPASDANKQKACTWIADIKAQGETDPEEAIKRAFSVGAEVIYLVTDGEFDRSVVHTIKTLNKVGKVTIHTITFVYKDGEKILKDIASQNGGKYRFVSEADLATLVQ
jgi:Mg-chelatase subunit ChlD